MKDIKDFDNYSVTKTGEIFSKRYSKFLKGSKNKDGYLTVELRKDKKSYTRYIHRLVAETFLEKRENKTHVNHKDGNRNNNNIENLEWVTNKENIRHGILRRKGKIKTETISLTEIKKLKLVSNTTGIDLYQLIIDYFNPL